MDGDEIFGLADYISGTSDLRNWMRYIHNATPEQELELYDNALSTWNWPVVEFLIKRGILFVVKTHITMKNWIRIPEHIRELYQEHYIQLMENNGNLIDIDAITDYCKKYPNCIEKLYTRKCNEQFLVCFNSVLRVLHCGMVLTDMDHKDLSFPNLIELKMCYIHIHSDVANRIGSVLFPKVEQLYILGEDRYTSHDNLRGLWPISTLKSLNLSFPNGHVFYQRFEELMVLYPNLESLTTNHVDIHSIMNRINGLKYLSVTDGYVDYIQVPTIYLNKVIVRGLLCGNLTIPAPFLKKLGKQMLYGDMKNITKIGLKTLNISYFNDREIDDIMDYLSAYKICEHVVFTKN